MAKPESMTAARVGRLFASKAWRIAMSAALVLGLAPGLSAANAKKAYADEGSTSGKT